MPRTGIWLLVLLGGMSATAQAAVLGHFSFSETYFLPVSPMQEASSAITLQFGYSAEVGGVEDPATLVFDSFSFGAGDAGRVVTLTSDGNDPQFTRFIALAVNGFDDELRDTAIGNKGGGIGLIAPESFRLDAPLFPGVPDLAGATITALELFIGSIAINPAATSSQVNWSIAGELRFIGPTPVPLPGGLLLLAAALPCLTWRRRRSAPA